MLQLENPLERKEKLSKLESKARQQSQLSKRTMAFNGLKCLRGENKRLQSLVAKLSLQLKQKEDELAKRRVEVATLHQACAKNKRARIVPVQLLSTAAAATPFTTTANTLDAVSLRCEKAKDVFSELKLALEAFAAKLSTTFAEKEAQFSSALREKDDEIGKLGAALAKKEREEEERRQRIQRQKAEEQERTRKHMEDTIREMSEMEEQQRLSLEEWRRDFDKRKQEDDRKSQQRRRETEESGRRRQQQIEERRLQQQRETQQRLREIDQIYLEQVRLIEQRPVVQRRQRSGVADAA